MTHIVVRRDMLLAYSLSENGICCMCLFNCAALMSWFYAYSVSYLCADSCAHYASSVHAIKPYYVL